MKPLSFLKYTQNKGIFLRITVSIFVFVFINFFIHQTAGAQSIKLVIGKYECINNRQCSDKQYCDIDTHTCVVFPDIPDPECHAELCDLEEICPPKECHAELCDLEEICPPKECHAELCDLEKICPKKAGCDSNEDCKGSQQCVNRKCVECAGSFDCKSGQFCSENVCRDGCKTSADCAAETPYCYTALGICLPCSDDAPCFDKSLNKCVSCCTKNADCKDETRPFCRIENSAENGTCGCPDKTSYLPEYQTCGYKWDVKIEGYGKRGLKHAIYAGGSSGDRPFAEADYKVFFVNELIDDYVKILQDKKGIGELRNSNKTQDQVFTFPKGSSFTAELWNEGKKNPFFMIGTWYFLFSEGFKK